MATCGYICPGCEGRGWKEDGSPCDWCQEKNIVISEEDKEEWLRKVHEGPCCSDFEEIKKSDDICIEPYEGLKP